MKSVVKSSLSVESENRVQVFSLYFNVASLVFP